MVLGTSLCPVWSAFCGSLARLRVDAHEANLLYVNVLFAGFFYSALA